MPTSPAAAWLVVSQQHVVVALVSSKDGAGSEGAGEIEADHQEKLIASSALGLGPGKEVRAVEPPDLLQLLLCTAHAGAGVA